MKVSLSRLFMFKLMEWPPKQNLKKKEFINCFGDNMYNLSGSFIK